MGIKFSEELVAKINKDTAILRDRDSGIAYIRVLDGHSLANVISIHPCINRGEYKQPLKTDRLVEINGYLYNIDKREIIGNNRLKLLLSNYCNCESCMERLSAIC